MNTMQISLPEPLFNQLQYIAAIQGATLHEFLEQVAKAYSIDTLKPISRTKDDWQEQHTQIESEQRAYVAQHPHLLRRYAGEYIAMQNGQVIDHDANRSALGKRIRAQYGNHPIFITPVLPEPIQVIQIHSPHFEHEPATA